MLDDRVVVLGATGYVGRSVVGALQQAGRTVVAVAQRKPTFLPSGVHFIPCDVGDARQLAIAIGRAGAVVNAVCATPSAMIRGARNLAEIAEHGRGARIVHVSSLAVFGQATGALDETALPVPARFHAYANAKLACEGLLRSVGAVVLRPGCIYGAGAPIWCERIGRLLLARRLGWLGPSGRGWCNVVHVDDVAHSVVRALDARAEEIGVHHVLAPDRLSWNDYFACFAMQLEIALARIGSIRLRTEIFLVAPLLSVRKFSGGVPDMISPSMGRAFRCRALPTATFPLLAPHEFRALDDGLAEAATVLLGRRMGRSGAVGPLATAVP